MVDNFPENRLALAITHGPRQARIIRQQIQQYHQTSAIDKSFPIRMGFVKRWSVEVTFEESRQILGVETQRQWSDKAIERTTPALFGLFSLVTLIRSCPLPQAAWYDKSEATFPDLLAPLAFSDGRSFSRSHVTFISWAQVRAKSSSPFSSIGWLCSLPTRAVVSE